jgi:hypothetical protein
MPFDNAPSTEKAPSGELSLYERLKILRELVPQSGDQNDFRTCLWSVARRDERLRAAGLGKYDRGHGCTPGEGIINFFGGGSYWGTQSKEYKIAVLEWAISAERAKVSTLA